MSSEFQVLVTQSFKKDFQKIKDSKLKQKIKSELSHLANKPHLGKKLKDTKVGQYRLRIGDYRVRYDILEKKIVLHRLRHRKDIYKL